MLVSCIQNKLESVRIEYTWLTDLASRRYASGKKGHALHVRNNNSKPPHYPPCSHKKESSTTFKDHIFDIMVKQTNKQTNLKTFMSFSNSSTIPLFPPLMTIFPEEFKNPFIEKIQRSTWWWDRKKAARPQHLERKKKEKKNQLRTKSQTY